MKYRLEILGILTGGTIALLASGIFLAATNQLPDISSFISIENDQNETEVIKNNLSQTTRSSVSSNTTNTSNTPLPIKDYRSESEGEEITSETKKLLESIKQQQSEILRRQDEEKALRQQEEQRLIQKQLEIQRINNLRQKALNSCETKLNEALEEADDFKAKKNEIFGDNVATNFFYNMYDSQEKYVRDVATINYNACIKAIQ